MPTGLRPLAANIKPLEARREVKVESEKV